MESICRRQNKCDGKTAFSFKKEGKHCEEKRKCFLAHLSTTCGRPMSVLHHQHLPCGYSRGHISCSNKLKFGRMFVLIKTRMSLNLGYLGS